LELIQLSKKRKLKAKHEKRALKYGKILKA